MKRIAVYVRCVMVLGTLHLSDAVVADDLAEIRTFVQQHCAGCHGADVSEGDVNLRLPVDQRAMLKNRDIWLRAREQLTAQTMPPPDEVQPTAAERFAFLAALGRTVQDVDWQRFHEPGRLSLARLTVAEYRHAIRDLFGVDLLAGQLLGKDPEGNTGFTNDRDSLTFPVFAFDDFLSEAERAVDAIRTYGKPHWEKTIEAEEAWAEVSDKSTALNDEQTAVVLKERNSPFQLNLTVPYPGLYELQFRAHPFNGEPLSAMSIVVNGRLTDRIVIAGAQPNDFPLVVYLNPGTNIVSLAYDPDRAPLLQPNHEPQVVPDEIARLAKLKNFSAFELPERFQNDPEAKRSWSRLNNVMQGFLETQRLAELLLERGQVDYERHTLTDGTAASSIANFSPTKVPFNLAAGKVAVLLDIPQSELEQRLKKSSNFSHADYARSVRAYTAAWQAKHPDRVRKKAGWIAIDRVCIASHARTLRDPVEGPDRLKAVFSGSTPDDAERILIHFGRRAYGRNLSDSEVTRLMSIYANTYADVASHQEALRDAVVGLLVSPPFLLRYSEPNRSGELVGEHEVARRLARFLWLSIPDEELIALADQGELGQVDVLLEQADRMVADPRFADAMRMFTKQWLNLETLEQAEDAAGISASVVLAMREEPVRLVHHIFHNDRPLTELLTAPYTFLNGPLARHYAIDGVVDAQVHPVPLSDRRRGGLLTMGAMHMVTSTPQRTSPVTRGAWIVELILGERLPPAPASVPELKVDNKARTVRQELELHRSVKQCAGCHQRIDPFGFALEHYDQFGAWRDRERGKPVNALTELPDGTQIDGLEALQEYLVETRRDEFLRNVTTRMFEFALGRPAEFTDESTIRQLVAALNRDQAGARTLIDGIITSDAFRKQSDE